MFGKWASDIWSRFGNGDTTGVSDEDSQSGVELTQLSEEGTPLLSSDSNGSPPNSDPERSPPASPPLPSAPPSFPSSSDLSSDPDLFTTDDETSSPALSNPKSPYSPEHTSFFPSAQPQSIPTSILYAYQTLIDRFKRKIEIETPRASMLTFLSHVLPSPFLYLPQVANYLGLFTITLFSLVMTTTFSVAAVNGQDSLLLTTLAGGFSTLYNFSLNWFSFDELPKLLRDFLSNINLTFFEKDKIELKYQDSRLISSIALLALLLTAGFSGKNTFNNSERATDSIFEIFNIEGATWLSYMLTAASTTTNMTQIFMSLLGTFNSQFSTPNEKAGQIVRERILACLMDDIYPNCEGALPIAKALRKNIMEKGIFDSFDLESYRGTRTGILFFNLIPTAIASFLAYYLATLFSPDKTLEEQTPPDILQAVEASFTFWGRFGLLSYMTYLAQNSMTSSFLSLVNQIVTIKEEKTNQTTTFNRSVKENIFVGLVWLCSPFSAFGATNMINVEMSMLGIPHHFSSNFIISCIAATINPRSVTKLADRINDERQRGCSFGSAKQDVEETIQYIAKQSGRNVLKFSAVQNGKNYLADDTFKAAFFHQFSEVSEEIISKIDKLQSDIQNVNKSLTLTLELIVYYHDLLLLANMLKSKTVNIDEVCEAIQADQAPPEQRFYLLSAQKQEESLPSNLAEKKEGNTDLKPYAECSFPY